jgi:hypothetical protein
MQLRPVHVVAIVGSICAAVVLAPVAVNAATGTAVNIVDKFDVNSKVRISSKGTMWTTPTDPATGVTSKVDSAGRQVVVADMRTPANPLDTINDLTVSSGDTRRQLFAGVGSKKITLTSLMVSGEAGAAGSIKLQFIAYVKSNSASGDCETLSGFGAAERFTVMVPVGTTVNLTWPSGMTWTQYADANDFYCIDVDSYGGPASYVAHVSAWGFKN